LNWFRKEVLSDLPLPQSLFRKGHAVHDRTVAFGSPSAKGGQTNKK